jgi:hypothetical protein
VIFAPSGPGAAAGEVSSWRRSCGTHVQLLDNGSWRTAQHFGEQRSRQARVGANIDTVKDVLTKHPDLFVSRTGECRQRSLQASDLYRLAEGTRSPESPEPDQSALPSRPRPRNRSRDPPRPHRTSEARGSEADRPRLGAVRHPPLAEVATGVGGEAGRLLFAPDPNHSRYA